MSSSVVESPVLLGEIEPQIVHLPPDVHSLDAATEAIELANAYLICDGHPLDGAQEFTLTQALGTRRDGSWAATSVADFEPRQNGKNDTCNARELAGLLLWGERLIIHTAHEFATANESFLRLVAVFENWDDLRAKVARVRYANGEQGIELLDGGRLKYRARTGGAGRGFTKAALVVYDEAQHLKAEHVAASGPAKLANPNSQSWYMGSGGMSTSTNAWRLRKQALKGDAGRLCYLEHTAEVVSVDEFGRVSAVRPEILDRVAWARANPAYGWRVADEKFFDLLGELGPELFARECLNVWDPEVGAEFGAWPPEVWAAVQDVDAEPSGPVVVGVDASPDRSVGSVAVAGGGVVALVTDERGRRLPVLFGDLAAEAVRLARKFSCVVALDPAGPAASIVPDLERAGVEVFEVAGRAMGAACGALHAAVSNRSVRVRRHADLSGAVSGARTLPRGDVWVWARKDTSVDVSPLVAVTLAWWAASQAVEKKRPVFAS